MLPLLPAYLEGHLDSGHAADIDAHLKTCSSCLQEMELQAQVDARVRDTVLSEPIDVTDLDRLIRENLSAELHRNAHQQFESVRRRWAAATIGVVAILLLLGVGYHTLFGKRPAGVYAAAAADHRVEIVEEQPRAWFTNPSQIEGLAESQGVPPAAVQVLGSGTYHLDRGKLCWLDGRIFLHLAFSDGAHKFSLYLRPRDAGELFVRRLRLHECGTRACGGVSDFQARGDCRYRRARRCRTAVRPIRIRKTSIVFSKFPCVVPP